MSARREGQSNQSRKWCPNHGRPGWDWKWKNEFLVIAESTFALLIAANQIRGVKLVFSWQNDIRQEVFFASPTRLRYQRSNNKNWKEKTRWPQWSPHSRMINIPEKSFARRLHAFWSQFSVVFVCVADFSHETCGRRMKKNQQTCRKAFQGNLIKRRCCLRYASGAGSTNFGYVVLKLRRFITTSMALKMSRRSRCRRKKIARDFSYLNH